MMLELEPNTRPAESAINAATNPAPNLAEDADRDASTHGTVEPCQFEELLERAMEILRTRRATAGSLSS
jgi:hypothetical protein